MSLIDDIRRNREEGTPGPWDLYASHPHDGWDGFTLLAESNGRSHEIGTVNGPKSKDCTWVDAERIVRVPDMEAALLAAEELANAVHHERNMVCQDFDLQHQASEAVDDALAAFRRTTEADQ